MKRVGGWGWVTPSLGGAQQLKKAEVQISAKLLCLTSIREAKVHQARVLWFQRNCCSSGLEKTVLGFKNSQRHTCS